MLTSRGTWRRRSPSNRPWLPALLLAAILVTGCGATKSKPKPAADGGAGLVFTRQSGQISGVWVADADGANPRQIVANGSGGTLSPDGRLMTYRIPQGSKSWVTNVKEVAIGDPLSLGKVTVLDWSPDSKRLAVQEGNRLLLVDAGSGQPRELARGAVGGASFSSDGKAIAFSRGNGKKAPAWRSDVFVVRLSDGSESRLTSDGHSDDPQWGGTWIGFRRFHYDADVPIGAIYLMHSDGTEVKRLSTGKEAPGGLDALELSREGTKLLACAPAGSYCPPVMFDIPGSETNVSVSSKVSAADLSEDGSQVLALADAAEGPPALTMIPFGGGSGEPLVENVSSARWAG